MMAPSSGFGRQLLGRTGPAGAELAREPLRRRIARAREGVHLLVVIDGELGDDVRGGAEAVDAEPAHIADELPRAVSDEPGTHQRSRLRVGVLRGNGERVGGVGGDVFGITAVERVAGETGPIAQVLLAAAAELATPARGAEPGYADTVADLEAGNVRADGHDAPDDLVAWNDVRLWIGEFAIDYVQIGAADGAGRDAQQDVVARGRRHRALDLSERFARAVKGHGRHAAGERLQRQLPWSRVLRRTGLLLRGFFLPLQSISTTETMRKVRITPSCSLSETYSPGANRCLSKR